MRLLLILALFTITLGVVVPQQKSMVTKLSRIEKIISKFLELSSMSTQFDFSKLFQAIDELAEGLRQAQQDENTLFDKDFQQYVEDQAFYSDLITFYKAEVALHSEDLRSLNNHLASYEEQLQSRLEELDNTQKQKSELEEQIRQNEITFNKALSEFNAAIEVIDEALALLQQLRNNPVFLQTNSVDFLQVGQKMHSLNFKHHRILYQPIVDALLQMSQDKMADQDMLKRVVNLLQNLRNTLDGGRTSLIANYNSEKESNLALLEQYKTKIDSLLNTIIPALKDLIANTIEQIKVKTILLNDAQANLDDAIETLKSIEDRWLRRKIQHKALMDEYDHELLLISQAVAALEQGGVRRQ